MSWVILWVSDHAGANVLVSESFAEVTGRTPAEVRADGWTHLVHPDDCAMVLAGVYQARTRGLPIDLRYRFRVQSGEYVWCRDVGLPMEDGTYHGFLEPTGPPTPANPPPDAHLVTIQEAARRVGVSVDTLYRLARTAPGTWAHRARRKWLIDVAALRVFLRTP